MTSRMFRGASLPVILLASTACTLEPRYERPAPPVPDSWPAADTAPQTDATTAPAIGYADVFKDARLASLVATALANNRDLRAAVANVEVARAQYRVQRGGLLPGIDVSATATRRDASTGNDSVNAGTTYSADVGTTAFELDLFGRVRSLSRAALNGYFATEAGMRATRLALAGDVALAWLNYAADSSLIALAEETVASGRRSVELTRARLEGGIAPRTDLRQAEIILHQALSDQAEARTLLAQDLNALQLLVGASVDPALLPASIDEAGAAVGEVAAGTDTSVLLRRPDVVQAEYELKAANADIGAARAALLPRISLTALAGYSARSIDALFTNDSETSSASAGLSLPLFAGGANRARLAEAQARQQAAIAEYEGDVQTAFREVADALARYGTIAGQEQSQRSLVEAARDNYQLSDARYRGGVDSFLQSLDAQRSLYGAQQGLVATQLARAANRVLLYRTLGGGERLDVEPEER